MIGPPGLGASVHSQTQCIKDAALGVQSHHRHPSCDPGDITQNLAGAWLVKTWSFLRVPGDLLGLKDFFWG